MRDVLLQHSDDPHLHFYLDAAAYESAIEEDGLGSTEVWRIASAIFEKFGDLFESSDAEDIRNELSTSQRMGHAPAKTLFASAMAKSFTTVERGSYRTLCEDVEGCRRLAVACLKDKK